MPTNDEIKAAQASLWGAAARAWHDLNDELERHSGPVNRWLCEAAGLQPGMSVLDLACGAGQPADRAAAMVAPGGRVIATDIAPEMVEATRQRAKALGLDNLESRLMDMETLDFPDESFDAITCRWGFMFPPDVARAASEARRVLKKGGRLATATWDKRDLNAWLGISAFERHLDPLLPPPTLDPNAPSPLRFTDSGFLAQLFLDAGFSDVSVESLGFAFDFPTAEDWWEFVTGLNGPLTSRLRRLNVEQMMGVRTRVIGEIEAMGSGAGLSLSAACLCVAATK